MFVCRLVPDNAVRPCQNTAACPDFWLLDDGDVAVIGTDITALANELPPEAGCAPHERIVKVPWALFIAAKANIPSQA